MITKAQLDAADIAFRAERGGWFVIKNKHGVSGVLVSSDERLRLIRENRAAAKKYAIRIVYFREGEAAVKDIPKIESGFDSSFSGSEGFGE